MLFRSDSVVRGAADISPRRQAEAAGPIVAGLQMLLGLALLSKYTSALLGVAVLAALLIHPDGARMRTVWPWLAAVVAVAVFSPVLIWNSEHHWASFRFQLSHGLGQPVDSSILARLGRLGEYVGGQIAVYTPVLFGLGCVAVASVVRNFRRVGIAHQNGAMRRRRWTVPTLLSASTSKP